MEFLARWWDAVLAGFGRGESLQAPLPVLLGLLAVAAVVSVPRASWRWFGLYVTFVHELGHAFAALMTGRMVHGLKIGLDHSGELVSSGRGRFGAAWSGFWGYPAPAVVGAALIWAAGAGYSGAALSIGALLLLASLIFIRNWAGILVSLCCALIAQLLVLFAAPTVVAWVILCLGIGLLVGSVRDWFKVAAVHVRHRNRIASSDAYLLARRTGGPAWLWLSGFAVVILAAVSFSVYQFSFLLA
ncbi:M50 family metallopeptidase [Paeniglutamicibacter cryotolerans]|uniref:M50 family metallopeptidase n=1 Tax=Paeniglutamicibacter cryotolerans TaxID=670079 RepID=A0A839QGS0_9MICC|nr:M50 family metallopeptidase [Paeniglutamicibacter cryotolerans]MBB2995548.1 hypothetical protein [Paeniglutamicibacter cryotolerans]